MSRIKPIHHIIVGITVVLYANTMQQLFNDSSLDLIRRCLTRISIKTDCNKIVLNLTNGTYLKAIISTSKLFSGKKDDQCNLRHFL